MEEWLQRAIDYTKVPELTNLGAPKRSVTHDCNSAAKQALRGPGAFEFRTRVRTNANLDQRKWRHNPDKFVEILLDTKELRLLKTKLFLTLRCWQDGRETLRLKCVCPDPSCPVLLRVLSWTDRDSIVAFLGALNIKTDPLTPMTFLREPDENATRIIASMEVSRFSAADGSSEALDVSVAQVPQPDGAPPKVLIAATCIADIEPGARASREEILDRCFGQDAVPAVSNAAVLFEQIWKVVNKSAFQIAFPDRVPGQEHPSLAEEGSERWTEFDKWAGVTRAGNQLAAELLDSDDSDSDTVNSAA